MSKKLKKENNRRRQHAFSHYRIAYHTYTKAEINKLKLMSKKKKANCNALKHRINHQQRSKL